MFTLDIKKGEKVMKKLLAVLISVFLLAMGGLTLTACGEDELKTFEYATFKSQTYMYDGLEKSIEVDGIPSGTTVTYDPINKQTEVGVYEITATIKKDGYESKTLTATLTIVKTDKYTIEEINALLAELNGALDSAKTETERLIGQIKTEYTAKINALTEQLNADKLALETLEKTYKDKVANIEATASANKTELENKLASDKAELNADIEALEKAYLEKVKELEETANANKQELESKLASDKAELNANIKALESQIASVEAEMNGKIADLTSKVTALENRIKELEDKLNSDHAHTYGEWVVVEQPTCIDNGIKYRQCGDCKAVDIVSIDFIGHDYVYGECDVCGEIDTTYMSEGLTFTLINDGNEYAVSGHNYIGTNLIIPAVYRGKNVTTIKENAFAYLIGNVVLPETLTTIENSAFVECKFNSINYLGTVDQWVEIDFYSNPISSAEQMLIKGEELTDVKLTTATKISPYAFAGCTSLTSVEIPSSITSISDGAFYGCSSLASVTLPNNLTSIGEQAFAYCSSLTSIAIPSDLVSIGNMAFIGCDSLLNILITDLSAWLNIPNVYNLMNYGEEIKIIRLNNETLTELIIPDGVTVIWAGAFRGCVSLTSVVIPNSVTNIYNNPFYGCTSLKYNVKDGLKYLGNSENKYLYLAGVVDTSVVAVDIDSNCRIIGAGAFEQCENLTSITIPDGVTSIGIYAFRNCTSLASIEIPNSVTSIGTYVFHNCTSLESIVIPHSVTEITGPLFGGSYSLTIYVEVDLEAEGWPVGWSGEAFQNAAVYWAGGWQYVDGVPTPINN